MCETSINTVFLFCINNDKLVRNFIFDMRKTTLTPFLETYTYLTRCTFFVIKIHKQIWYFEKINVLFKKYFSVAKRPEMIKKKGKCHSDRKIEPICDAFSVFFNQIASPGTRWQNGQNGCLWAVKYVFLSVFVTLFVV